MTSFDLRGTVREHHLEQIGEYSVLPATTIAFDVKTDSAYGSVIDGVLCPLTEEHIKWLNSVRLAHNAPNQPDHSNDKKQWIPLGTMW